jgi:hypothetical protein
VYVRGSGSNLLLVGVYVDDLVVVGANQAQVDRFKAEMARLFSMSDLGPLHYYLGIEVRQGAKGISFVPKRLRGQDRREGWALGLQSVQHSDGAATEVEQGELKPTGGQDSVPQHRRQSEVPSSHTP